MKGQNIELPEFVITGVENVYLPPATKVKAEIKSVLSEDFFKPVYSPEEFRIASFSQPVRIPENFNVDPDLFSGRLLLGLGLHTIPVGDLYLNKNFNNLMLSGNIWGMRETEYVKYAGLNNSGLSGRVNYFIGDQSSLLPGSVVSADFIYSRENFNLFSSPTPNYERKTDFTRGRISISNNDAEVFSYGLGYSFNSLNINDISLNENTRQLKLSAALKLESVKLQADGEIQSESFSTFNRPNLKNNFYVLGLNSRFNFGSKINFNAGLNFSSDGSASFISPQASISVLLSKQLTLLGEFKPFGEKYLHKDYLLENRYYYVDSVNSVFTRNRLNTEIALKYEYESYFEISGGVNYRQVQNKFYFEKPGIDDYLYLRISDKAIVSRIFLNLLFNPGPNGTFYGRVEFSDIKDDSGARIPYSPKLKMKLNYEYQFDFGFGINSQIIYRSPSYSDLQNVQEINNYVNINLLLFYRIFDDFRLTVDLRNILNKSNYVYLGYQEKPFDIIAGIDYRW